MKTCTWIFDDLHDKYDTECGNAQQFEYEWLEQSGYKFCPYCGLAIIEDKEEPAP